MDKLKGKFLSLPGETKESIPDRLRKLIGKRSVRAAAKDWGLSFSTLNNYLTRGTEPSLSVARQIAMIEGVTIEWICGSHCEPHEHHEEAINIHNENAKLIMNIINALDAKDIERLSKTLALNGAKYLTRVLEPENQELLRLEGRKRVAALLLDDLPDERVREILEEIESSKLSNSVKSQAG
ncbi:XRE family transcriptional regulator [Escherichia coli]|uniref:XRE family transcriptional regulator n=1 Tax=Escherichia coli TaxID=562 RepID=UPI0019D07A2F|nr:XRE family transcriptional regulator [Escherichia coli]MBN6412584.1 XRE family transcriptional regulator [Escherichia coli]